MFKAICTIAVASGMESETTSIFDSEVPTVGIVPSDIHKSSEDNPTDTPDFSEEINTHLIDDIAADVPTREMEANSYNNSIIVAASERVKGIAEKVNPGFHPSKKIRTVVEHVPRVDGVREKISNAREDVKGVISNLAPRAADNIEKVVKVFKDDSGAKERSLGGNGRFGEANFIADYPVGMYMQSNGNMIDRETGRFVRGGSSRMISGRRPDQGYGEPYDKGFVPEPLDKGLVPEPRFIPSPHDKGFVPRFIPGEHSIGMVPEPLDKGLVPEPRFIPSPHDKGFVPRFIPGEHSIEPLDKGLGEHSIGIVPEPLGKGVPEPLDEGFMPGKFQDRGFAGRKRFGVHNLGQGKPEDRSFLSGWGIDMNERFADVDNVIGGGFGHREYKNNAVEEDEMHRLGHKEFYQDNFPMPDDDTNYSRGHVDKNVEIQKDDRRVHGGYREEFVSGGHSENAFARNRIYEKESPKQTYEQHGGHEVNKQGVEEVDNMWLEPGERYKDHVVIERPSGKSR